MSLPMSSTFAQNLIPDISNAKPVICSFIEKNLKYGDTDSKTSGSVTELQNYLFSSGYYPHSGNGQYGWATYHAVAKFQTKNNLPSTGFFGPMSRGYIKESSCVINNAKIEDNVNSREPVVEKITLIDKNKDIALPYNVSNGFIGWKSTWGLGTTTEEGYYRISAIASTTGAEAVLVGSENWFDYSYNINFNVNRNGTFSMLGRFVDENNFIACTFSADAVSIQQRLNGVSTNLATARIKILQEGSVYISTQVNMKVIGNKISCSGTGGEDVVATINESKFLKGGIGLAIWHSVPNISQLELREVTVNSL